MQGMKDQKRILLLENEFLIAADLEKTVSSFGFSVVGPAATCAEALELIRSQEVDAAIIDLMNGQGRCDPVADELNARGIPWALGTGFDVRALNARFQGVLVLTKPYKDAEVFDLLYRLLPTELRPSIG